MSAKFAKAPLADLCLPNVGIQTGPFGSQLHASDYVEYGTPIITVEHLGENRIIHSDLPRVTNKDGKRLSRYTLITGDIVFSRVGSVDRRAIVHPAENGWLFSGRCLRVRPDLKKIDPGFLSWFFGLPTFQEHIRQIAVGATMPSLNTKILGDVTIYYPPSLKEQQAIAHILGTLDDKIELNRKMNRTLEAMAQAVFKSWFVDFDPVRAKSAGRDHGLPKKIADLFPDSFEDSEFGEIPKEWRVRRLPEVMHVNPSRSLTKGALAPYLDMANMPIQGPSPEAWVMREMGSGMKFENGDTLVARITPCLENGKTAFVDFLANGEVGWGSTEYIVLRPKGAIPPPFAYLLARTDEFRTFAIQQMTGSSGRQRVPATSLDKYSISTPDLDSPLFQRFGNLVSPMFNRIKAAMMQSHTLAALRDTLLLKLISGELRMKDAERIVGKVVA
ncbi:MAG: restriction endonuclease subunit S [Syntrophus sp. (in: bacteria)]|nr:restriction endonuclease subunit S [Syntrophus sp. (in: bacteria)]